MSMAMSAVQDHPISDDDSADDYDFDTHSAATMVRNTSGGTAIADLDKNRFTTQNNSKRTSKFSLASNASFHSARDDADSIKSSAVSVATERTPRSPAVGIHDSTSIDAYDHSNHRNYEATPTRTSTISRRDNSKSDVIPQRLFTTNGGSSNSSVNGSSSSLPAAGVSMMTPPVTADDQRMSESFPSSSSLSSSSHSDSNGEDDHLAAMNAAVAAAIRTDGASPVMRGAGSDYTEETFNPRRPTGLETPSTASPQVSTTPPHPSEPAPPLPHDDSSSTIQTPALDAQAGQQLAPKEADTSISAHLNSFKISAPQTQMGTPEIGTPSIDDAQFETSKNSLVDSLKAAGSASSTPSDFSRGFVGMSKTNLSTSSISEEASASEASSSLADIDDLAQKFFTEKHASFSRDEYAAWLGDDRALNKQVCAAYMNLFNWKNLSILNSLRRLCERLYMKGESQQLSRIIEHFAAAWVQANPRHGFVSATSVYTIAYALILLNTDLYAADHSLNKPISKSQFIKNTSETVIMGMEVSHGPSRLIAELKRDEYNDSKDLDTVALVNEPFAQFSSREWVQLLQNVLRVFYNSISKSPLQIRAVDRVAKVTPISPIDTLAHTHTTSSTRQTSSIFSKFRLNKPKAGDNMSRIDASAAFSGSSFGNDPFGRRNSMQSNFSMETGMSSGSFTMPRQAVGFAGILWNAMAKEDSASSYTGDVDDDDFMNDISKLEEEFEAEDALQLFGAPWAKEGLLLYRPYVDPHSGKRTRKQKWKSLFVVVQKGQLKLFDLSAKKSNTFGAGQATVGGGNWMENADTVDAWSLCHTIAQELPNPKRSKSYQALWSLTLPQYGLLVFQAGTTEIAKEFVYTCNYWSARLSKEPMNETVSNMEYGWSFLESSESDSTKGSSASSSTSSFRTGDVLAIKEWKPRGHSLVVSDFNEDRQLVNIKEYLTAVETQLSSHNGLLPKMLSSYTPGSQNHSKAHANWERKSQYLLQQTVRFRVYVDALETGIEDRKIVKNGGDPSRRRYDVIEEE